MQLKIDVQQPTSSQYEVLHHFAKDLHEALIRQGADCRLLSGNDRLLAVLHDPPDFTIGFNGALKMEDNSFFCDHVKVPHVACLIDPSYRFLELTKSPFIVIACDDKEGCAFLKDRHFERTIFMPHAVGIDQGFSDKKPIYDIVFLGTCIDPEGRKAQWKKIFPPTICMLMNEAIETGLSEKAASFISVLSSQLDPCKYQSVFEEVELYIKGIDRLRLLEAFTANEVHIFGSSLEKKGWQQLLHKHPNLIVHPAVSYQQAIEIMKQSKIVLNSSLKNKQGAHERIFTAMACGAVAVTNEVPYMKEHFKNGKEILLYSGKDLPKLEGEIKALLKDEDKRLAIAEAGRKRVLKEHTWENRAERLLQEVLPLLKKIRKRH